MNMRTARRRTTGAVVAALAAALLPWQSASAEDSSTAAPPEVLPTLRHWQGDQGEFTLTDRTRIVLDGVRDSRTTADAGRFAGELNGGAPVSRSRAAPTR